MGPGVLGRKDRSGVFLRKDRKYAPFWRKLWRHLQAHPQLARRRWRRVQRQNGPPRTEPLRKPIAGSNPLLCGKSSGCNACWDI
jgi:hypothetical protein